MAWKLLAIVVILTYFPSNSVEDGKYSRNINQNDAARSDKLKKERPFRMNKVNLVWEKAKKKLLSETKLTQLYIDLKTQDKLEVEAKKQIQEDMDKDGEYQAAVRIKMMDILDKYNLHDETWPGKDDNQLLMDENLTIDKKFRTDIKPDWDRGKLDKRLEKLWEKAKQSGFTDEELSDLRKEFTHHQTKLDEFNQLKNELPNMEGFDDNMIKREKNRADGLKLKQKNSELKEKHRDLKESFLALQERSKPTVEGDKQVEFSEPKVVELWLMAQKVNFSSVELESFKEELRHFEHKVKKHEYFQEQVEHSAQYYKKRKDKDNLADMPPKHQVLEEKAKDYGFKVKKIHHELKTRLSERLHSEL